MKQLFWKVAFLAGYGLLLGALWSAVSLGAEADRRPNEREYGEQNVEARERNAAAGASEYRSEYVIVRGPEAARIGRQCDAIVRSLETRYGKPRYWRAFPVTYAPGRGGAVAGYTSYSSPNVEEVAIFQTFESSVGGTLDHELTHAFFFYYFESNFDLFLNEGLAQNSEYASRPRLRAQVYTRGASGEFLPLASLYGLNRYDPGALIYTQGFSVVDFLIARGGSRWFAAFVDELTNERRDITNALERFYGYRSLDELERAWLEYVCAGQDRKRVGAVGTER